MVIVEDGALPNPMGTEYGDSYVADLRRFPPTLQKALQSAYRLMDLKAKREARAHRPA
jgi:hypothetical protein